MKKLRDFLFKNTSTRQTVAKNTVWLFLGEVGGRLLKLAIVVFATRQLGIDGWGVFSYGLAFVSFFYILGDFGVNTFITRELSKENGDTHKHLAASVLLKIVPLVILFALSLLIGPHVGNIRLGLPLIAVLSILYFSDSLREFVLSINRSLGKMEREAFSKILMNSIITALGIILIVKDATPLSLAIAYATGSAIATFFIAWSIRGEYKKITWTISKESIRIIYNFSWPIIIISMFSFVFNIDSIMLGQMRSAADVGLYAAAQRIVQFAAVIPGFIAMAVFPILSKNESDNEKFSGIFEKVMAIVFAIGIPLAIAGFLLSAPLMSLVFGSQYAAGGLTLGILMLSLLASFPNIILTNVIFSKNLQRSFIAATSIGVAVNIALNFLLIPPYGPVGAAISVSVTQMLIATINWQKLKAHISFSVIPKIGNLLLASFVMALVTGLLLVAGVHVAVISVCAILAYLLSLLLLREPSLTELLLLVRGR